MVLVLYSSVMIHTVTTNELEIEDTTFPAKLTGPAPSSKPLILIGKGVTEMTIETIVVKFTNMAVYVDPEIAQHLRVWKGKQPSELLADESPYFGDFVDAPVQKLVKIGIVKGIRGSAYAGGLESSIRDRLAYQDKYEEEEEASLEELVNFLSLHNLSVGSSIYYYWPSPSVIQVNVSKDGSLSSQPEAAAGHVTANENVAKFLLHWLIGENAISESTALSTAQGVAAL